MMSLPKTEIQVISDDFCSVYPSLLFQSVNWKHEIQFKDNLYFVDGLIQEKIIVISIVKLKLFSLWKPTYWVIYLMVGRQAQCTVNDGYGPDFSAVQQKENPVVRTVSLEEKLLVIIVMGGTENP